MMSKAGVKVLWLMITLGVGLSFPFVALAQTETTGAIQGIVIEAERCLTAKAVGPGLRKNLNAAKAQPVILG